jgi:hypothetical protein
VFLINYCMEGALGTESNGMGIMNDGWKHGSTMNEDLRTEYLSSRRDAFCSSDLLVAAPRSCLSV